MKFDAIIIGSGQAGNPLAFKLAAKGKKVAHIEKEHLGGTCLNVGCTPTKTYVASARRMFDALNGEVLGVSIPKGTTLNLGKVKQLKAAGIKTDERGYIQVTDRLETTIAGVYALGDCNGKGAFTHTAFNDFEIVYENLFEQGNRKVSDRILTYGLFVDPPLGRAGITLKESKDQNLEILVGYRAMNRIARAKEKGETDGFIRVIVDKKTDKILGATVLGVCGDEIISSILNVMYGGNPYTVIRDGVFPHPTVSELIPTLLEDLQPG